MPTFAHSYPFDPTYGMDLEALLAVEVPPEPDGYTPFWETRYGAAMSVEPEPTVSRSAEQRSGFEVFDLQFRTSDGLKLGGWVLKPAGEPVTRGIVVGHGYGGRDAPDFDLGIANAVVLFPCMRGISRSRQAPFSEDPNWHILHDIDKRDHYVIGGCIEDIWLAVSALIRLFPEVRGDVGYIGKSFGGGLGAMALPWDRRITVAQFTVPTFGHQPLRLRLPTVGSGAAIAAYEARRGNVLETLRYFDAAVAARHVDIPVLVAAALFDPAVAPPGQFAVFNALAGPKELFVLSAGHFEYPAKVDEERSLAESRKVFFDLYRRPSDVTSPDLGPT